ncbi:MAG: DUF3108 domain-containing protein [Paludibacter sp.]|nr:DUF3108 domain-containing protein [Paludibacter sp.]
MKRLVISISILLLSVVAVLAVQISSDSKKLILNEKLQYKVKWGLLTIGTASASIDRRIYRIGSDLCCKIELKAQTNGIARLFYMNNHWVSYVTLNSITTRKSLRSISEGKYRLEEIVDFNSEKKQASLREYDKSKNKYILKNLYETPERTRDVVAGFMLTRVIDFSTLQNGDRIRIDGFYKKDGYKIDVIYVGKEYLKTAKGKIFCHKIKPIVPKNKVFDGVDAVEVWLTADRTQHIVFARAQLVFGELEMELASAEKY